MAETGPRQRGPWHGACLLIPLSTVHIVAAFFTTVAIVHTEGALGRVLVLAPLRLTVMLVNYLYAFTLGIAIGKVSILSVSAVFMWVRFFGLWGTSKVSMHNGEITVLYMGSAGSSSRMLLWGLHE